MFRRVPVRRPTWKTAGSGWWLRLTTALLGVALLGVAIVSGVAAGHQAARQDLDHALASEAASNAHALREYFERASSINLLLAHDSAFRRFEPGVRAAAHTRSQTVADSSAAGSAMAYLERLYPGRISEACLIDSTGTELARVVRQTVAPAEELSAEEAENPFFAPTMRLPKDRVYQAAPYVSPDTGLWVISNSTPMVGASGRPWGLVHFEVALESFRPLITAGGLGRGFSAAVLDTTTGRMVLESGRALGRRNPGRPAPSGLLALTAGKAATSSAANLSGRRVVVMRVPAGGDNANTWAVVVSAPASTGAWSRSIGPGLVAMVFAAVLLLTFAGLNLRASHRELRTASLTDDLTGLPNRRLLDDRIDHALQLARRRGTCSAVLIIDLDRFKEVNDTLGHDYGDELLRGVADRLRGALRESDTLARLGGDEFAVLLPEVADEDAAVQLAGRCLRALHESFPIGGFDLDIEASIGLALAPLHGRDGTALLRAADVAMYEAKNRSGAVAVYESGLDVNTPSRLALLGDLRRALFEGELVMHYQPKVDLDTDTVRGVEALVRWAHPARGLVPPDEFIPVAEGTGLILPLTLHTLDLAIAQARAWYDRGQRIQVAVNLSPRCLLEARLPVLVQELLDKHGVSSQQLRLEITESSIMADPPRAIAVLTALQQAGISLSIDDFGTGYSSMSYLKTLPIDELKIDRCFVMGMLANCSDGVLVRSAIDLGHNLGFSVVAEGVEDQLTMSALAELGCDIVQGYHLARPMSGPELTTWLDARRAGVAPAVSGR